MHNEYYIYMMTNRNNTVIYTGITNDLKRRIYEHKEKRNPSVMGVKINSPLWQRGDRGDFIK